MFTLDESNGRVAQAEFCASPNFDSREDHNQPEAIIVHCISLPAGEYGGDQINQFFCNQLDCSTHPSFKDIESLRVSSHFLIRRDGHLLQFVSTRDRAWHAGESFCLDKPMVNDFSVGVELEGLDTDPNGFSDQQYCSLNALCIELVRVYKSMDKRHVFAHSDIAPGRKTDPGPFFDWAKLSLG